MKNTSSLTKLTNAAEILDMLEILVSACESSDKKLPLKGIMLNIRNSKDQINSVLKDFEAEKRADPVNINYKETTAKKSISQSSEDSLKSSDLEFTLEKPSSELEQGLIIDENFKSQIKKSPVVNSEEKTVSEKETTLQKGDSLIENKNYLSEKSKNNKISISDRIRAIPRVRTFNVSE